MTRSRSIRVLAIVALLLVGLALGADTALAAAPGDLDLDVRRSLNTFDVPGASIAIIEGERRLSWDERVADVLPGFRFGDSWVSENIPRRLRYLTPRNDFRSGFAN